MPKNIKFLMDTDIRVDCIDNAPIVGTAHKGDILEFTTYINGWYQLEDCCWIFIEKDGERTVKETDHVKLGRAEINSSLLSSFKLQLFAKEDEEKKDEDKDKDGKAKDNASEEAKKKAEEAAAKKKKELEDYGNDLADAASALLDGGHDVSQGDLRIENLFGIFGMPYQYLPTQDRRIDGNDEIPMLGRKYADKVAARMPLLVMVPGTPNFLAGYSDKEQGSIISEALSGVADVANILKSPGKYYEVKPNWADYFQNVDAMCQAAAIFMGVENREVKGQALSSLGNGFSWSNFSNDNIHSMLNYKGGVAFYVNADAQISESVSNSTTQSQLAEKINSISDLGREMQFLLGSNENLLGETVTETVKTDPTKDKSTAQKAADKLLSGGSLIGTITHSFDTAISGGKLIFPEIWADSQFSRDYNITIKLNSPDNDDFSVYMNIVVPLLHLLGFALPRGTGPSAFVSPFLVRASYKGVFNVDMGIISSMSITKGAEGCWNHYGIPTSVEVSFTLKELYGVMALANNNSSNYKLADNSILMDYIGNLCGCNINEPDIVRSIVYHALSGSSRPASYAKRIWDTIDQNIVNAQQRLFGVH